MVYLSEFNSVCHLERNEVESRDLRIIITHQVKSVRRSLDSLRSLGMTCSFLLQAQKGPGWWFHPGLHFTYSSIFCALRFLMARRTVRTIR